MILARTGPLIVMLALGGCTVGPDYTPPEIPVPATYASSDAVAQLDLAHWWTAFNDPVLNDLIERALRANLDVRQAAARVEQARAQERATHAAEGPRLNAGATAGYTRPSENSLSSSLGGLDTPSPGSPLAALVEGYATYQVGFDASWELDLFGGQKRANEAARARTEAASWSQRDVEVILAAEVARNYQQYRALNDRVAILDETITSERELLSFIEVRSKRGLVTSLDERRQQRTIEELSAQREDLAAQSQSRIHALGTLLGLTPTALTEDLSGPEPAKRVAIEVPPGLPSELLRRRPDIRAAERRLAAATADIGVATADIYPKFSLTGVLQLASTSLSTILETDSILASGTGGLSLPLLGGGASRATVEVREAQADEALLAYQEDILTALRDVEDSLFRLEADRRRVEFLRAAQNEARDAADTTAVQYRHGLIAFLEVLEARQSWLSARDALVQAEAANAQDVVALYKALGGGWDEGRMQLEGEGASGRGS